MKKSVAFMAICIASLVHAGETGRVELGAIPSKYTNTGERIEAYTDIAKRYPDIAGDAKVGAAWGYVALKNEKESVALAESVVKDYPDNTNLVVNALTCKAWGLMNANKFVEALAVLESCLRDYPGVNTAGILLARASCHLYGIKNTAAACEDCRMAIAAAPAGQGSLLASVRLAKILKGNASEVSAVCQAAVLKNASAVGGTEEIEWAFSQVDPVALGVEKYREFLTGVLLRVPAVEASAKFLGRVKSEVEKLK